MTFNTPSSHKSYSIGFSLIEMAVVLGIIVILMTLAIPSQLPRNARLQIEEGLVYANKLKPPIEFNYTLTQSLPVDNAAVNLSEPDKLITTIISHTEIKDGVINITFGNNALSVLKGKVLSLQPLTTIGNLANPLDWSCGFSKVPSSMQAAGKNNTSLENKYLPLKCRDLTSKK